MDLNFEVLKEAEQNLSWLRKWASTAFLFQESAVVL